jgi:DNA-binding transcriptional LysR family regulator
MLILKDQRWRPAINWNDLKHFVTVARHGSVMHAAQASRASATTITRHIDTLEAHLGVKLFHRRQTGYALTDAGRDLLPLAERMEQEAAFFERYASGAGTITTPVVRLELPEILASYVIVPGLKAFDPARAGIRLEIGNDAVSTRLTLKTADIVVRLHQPDHGDYKARRVGTIDRAIYGQRAYLDRVGAPLDTDTLDPFDLIGWTEEKSYLPTAKWFDEITNRRTPLLRTTNLSLQIDAIVAGLGIGALPKTVAEEHSLARVGQAKLTSDIWILRRAETEDMTAVTTVLDWVQQILKASKAQLTYA